MVASEQSINFTDLGNAKRLVQWHGNKIRYVHAWNAWLLWDSTRWDIDKTGGIYRIAKQTVARMYREAGELDSERERKKYVQWALNSESRTRIEAMIALARTEPGIAIKVEDLDTNQWLLNCLNGTVDLHTGSLKEHDPENLITKRLNIVYEPNAKAPTWEKFLKRVMNNSSDMIDYLQRAIGYTLTGDVSEQCLFFLLGTGRNGKSTFVETLLTLLGEYQCKTPTETLMKRESTSGVSNDVARLAGKRLVVAKETDEGQRLADATVKDLTGNDTITARFLYGELFDFKPCFKLWMYGNHKPLIRGTDEGIWRRMRLIPFDVTIPADERDPHLQDKLSDEMPGILRWAVIGCLRWQGKGLVEPKTVHEATAEYRSEMDVLKAFIEDCCQVSDTSWIASTGLYKSYTNWCDDNGERPLKQRELGLRLRERGFSPAKSSGGTRIWKGIGEQKRDEPF